MRIIKRYQNRKLYDTKGCHYLTVEELAQLIREGEDIQVINNKDRHDITERVLLQVLANQELKCRKEKSKLLQEVIRSGEGTFSDFILNTLNYEVK
jgi:polyhydroxyalkanoate synthesis repressor PhaR